jgi:hypothetical protein
LISTIDPATKKLSVIDQKNLVASLEIQLPLFSHDQLPAYATEKFQSPK